MQPFIGLLFSIVFLVSSAKAESPEFTPDRAAMILNKVDDLWRGSSSYSIISMRIKTKHYTRTIKMEGWSKGKEKSLVRIMAPLKEKGTATLKSGNNVYTYLPKTDRTIRLTSGMLMGSWMGSHFTNDDLVKESRLAEDYTAVMSFEGKRKGQPVVELTLIPKPESAVVWGKIVITVLIEDTIPLVADYFDEDLSLVRKMTFSEQKNLGGRMIPTVLRLIPTDEPDELTELVYEKMMFDIELDAGFFSLANLRRR